MKKSLQIKTLSSLAKVFPKKINSGALQKASYCLKGQHISYQIAFKLQVGSEHENTYHLSIKSKLADHIKIYRVEPVSVLLTSYHSARDDDYISFKPGLYPDILTPVENTRIKAAYSLWQSLWVEVCVPETIDTGIYPIEIAFLSDDENKTVVAKSVFKVDVKSESLPENELYITQWFHNDCIADIHNVPVFSDRHFELIDSYMKLAHDAGINMILTPILTPPLDTRIGTERPTVQLVDVTKQAPYTYCFAFDRFDRYIKLALKNGITNFEINHMFTQWGANATPKVIANINGKDERIFGWNVPSSSPEYKAFLDALIPAVIDRFEKLGVSKEHLFFHTSDEPNADHLENYAYCSKIILPLIKGCHHFDALSNYDFYKTGAVEIPVVSTSHITPFIEGHLDNLWCYYCCSGGKDVSNRFIAMPSYRNRIIGIQMYKYDIKGFLQWGYNFYYSRLSDRIINPFTSSDAEASFPAGDAFSVYPSANGATPSLRLKVFKEAIDDICLLKLVEKKIGKARVIQEIERIAEMEITFTNYPKGENFFEKLYEFIFSIIG